MTNRKSKVVRMEKFNAKSLMHYLDIKINSPLMRYFNITVRLKNIKLFLYVSNDLT